MLNRKTLLDLGFESLASWEIKNGQLDHEPYQTTNHRDLDELAKRKTILYAFTDRNKVLCFARSILGVKKCLNRYRVCMPSSDQPTNLRRAKNIRKSLEKKKTIETLVFFGDEKFSQDVFSTKLADTLKKILNAAFQIPKKCQWEDVESD